MEQDKSQELPIIQHWNEDKTINVCYYGDTSIFINTLGGTVEIPLDQIEFLEFTFSNM